MHPEQLGCIKTGDVFRGWFDVDSSILAVDGNNRSAPIFNLWLPFGHLGGFFAQNGDRRDVRNLLAGFNDGHGISFVPTPGFVIRGGEVVDLLGGFFDSGDAVFVDFQAVSPRPAGTFYANGGLYSFSGLVEIARIPEPGTLALAVLPLAFGAALRRRKKATAV